MKPVSAKTRAVKAYYAAKNRGQYAEKKNNTSAKSVGVVKKAIDKLAVGGIIEVKKKQLRKLSEEKK